MSSFPTLQRKCIILELIRHYHSRKFMNFASSLVNDLGVRVMVVQGWTECFLSQEQSFKGCRMGRSDKVSLWCMALLINTRFRFFILE